MRPRIKRWLKLGLLGLLGLIVALVATVVIAINTDWGQRQIKDQAEKALSGVFAGEVAIARLDVGLSGSVELEGLSITYPDGEQAIEVGRLSITCDLLPLLAGRVRCGELRVVEPRFWHRPEAGALLVPNDEEPKADVVIAAISIEDGRVEIPGDVISEIDGRLEGLRVRGADVGVAITKLTATSEAQKRSAVVAGKIHLVGDVVTLRDGVITTGDSALELALESFSIATLEFRGTLGGEIAAADVPIEGWRTAIAPELAVSGIAGESVSASGTIGLDQGSVEIERLSLGERLAGRLSIRGVDPARVHAAAPPGSITAEGIEIDVAPRFTLETLEGTAKVPLTGTLRGEALGTVSITATADAERLTAAVTAESSRGSGSVDVSAVRHPEAVLEIEKATATGQLASLAALVPGLRARSVVVNASARGRLDHLSVNGRATVRGVRYDQLAADKATAAVRLDAFDVFAAAETAHRGRFDVAVDGPRLGVTEAARLTASGTFRDNADRLDVTATITGLPRLERATVSAAVTLDDAITARIRSIDAVTDGLRWRGNTGVIRKVGDVITTPRKISLAGPGAALTAGAEIRPGRVSVDAEIRRLDLRRTRRLHGLEVAAIIDGRAEVTLRGERLTGELSASSGSIAIPGVPKVRGSVSAALDDRAVSLTVDGAPLEGKGTVHLAVTARRPRDIYNPAVWRRLTTADLIAVEGDIEGVDVDQVERFIGRTIEARGEAQVKLRLPHDGKPVLGIEVDARRGRYVGIGALRADLRASWGAALEATASITQDGDKLADVNLSLGAPLHALWQRPESLVKARLGGSLAITNFSLRRLERLAIVRISVGGFLSATAKVSGTALAPRIEIPDGRAAQVELAGVRLRRLSFSGTYSGDAVKGRVSGTMRTGGTFEIDAGFAIPGRELELDIGARGLNLTALQPFAPAGDHPLADLSGVVDFTNVEVNVDPKNLRTSGRVRLRNGSVLLEGGARAITAIDASLVLRGDRVRLATLSAKNGDGTIRASGEARFAGYTPEAIEIDVSAENIPYVAGSYLASLDLESTITGSYRDGALDLKAPVRRGRVDLKDTGVEFQSIGDLEDVVFVDAAAIKEREDDETPGRGLKTVLAIDLSRGVRVVTAEVDAVIVGEMKAAFVGAEMVSLTGQLRARSGRIKLFERSYALIRAEATFDGSLPINPDLDIEITRTFPEATVTAKITGRLSDVLSASSASKQIQLSSDADFSEEQILALMLGQSPDDVSQQATGGSRVGGIGRAIVATEVRDILRTVGLKVDVVRFHDDGWEFGKWVRFSLGDLFSRQVLLGYRFRDSGEQLKNTNEGTLELPVTRSVNLEGRVGDLGIGSFDLLWIKRF
jgi:hypothetical protein